MADIPALAVTIFIVLLILIVAAATIADYAGRLHEKKEGISAVARDKKTG